MCVGNDETHAIAVGRALGTASSTDLFELQVKGLTELSREGRVSLVIALRQALAEQLGIDRRELGFAIQKLLWDGVDEPAMILYDTAPGGAGYATRASDDLRGLLARACEVLECRHKQCDRACHGCLLGFDTDRFGDDLDRNAGLQLARAILAAIG